MRLLATIVCLAGLAACTSPSPVNRLTQAEWTATDLDIAEAAFRHLLLDNASGQQATASFYCIAITTEGGPGWWRFSSAPPGLSGRLKGSPVVFDFADCRTAEDSSVRSEKKDGTGIIFYLSSIVCAKSTSCEVRGGYYEGNLSASTNTLELAKQGGGWKVTEASLDSIS